MTIYLTKKQSTLKNVNCFFYFFAPSPWKYSFTNLMTVPESRKTAIRFGMDIRPLKVSAILHSRPRSIVAPRIATREYTTMKGFIILEENKNSIHLAPYSPQPMIVENAKQHMAIAVKMDTQLP